jgi:hypothetical protein
MISWVVLSKTRVELTPDSLRAHLDRFYPGLFLPPQELRNFVVEGPVLDAQFLIQASVPGSVGLYMLQSIAAGSTGFSEFADDIDDPALRALIFEQQAWLSVDVIDAAVDQDCRRFIGKVLRNSRPPTQQSWPIRIVERRYVLTSRFAVDWHVRNSPAV